MSIIKITKDRIIKFLDDGDKVPRGLFELDKYFRLYGSIDFDHKKEGDILIAKSSNFKQGSIITSGKNSKELDNNIKDAILTAFDVPSAYFKEAGIYQVGKNQEKYAIA